MIGEGAKGRRPRYTKDIQTVGHIIESETKTGSPRSERTRRGPIRNNGCLSTGRSQLPNPASGLLRLRGCEEDPRYIKVGW